MNATLYGVRGSFPVPSPECMRYGGHTTCIGIRTSAQAASSGERLGEHSGELLIIDAGTGLHRLGKTLPPSGSCSLLLTHEHWDHIIGLPFFAPLYHPDWHVDLYLPAGLEQVLGRLMDGLAFPLKAEQLAATVDCHVFQPGQDLHIAGINITTQAMPHPGGCVGLRLQDKDGTLAISSDCELTPNCTPELSESLSALLKDADIALVDGQYDTRNYPAHKGWGHTNWEMWVELAQAAGVRRLVLTHHDVDDTDQVLDARNTLARTLSTPNMHIEVAREGMTLNASLCGDVHV